MPRKRRFCLPDLPIHVLQRGNNRQAILVDDNDCRVYLDWLAGVRAHLAGVDTDWEAVAGKPGAPDIGELVHSHASMRGSLGTGSFVESPWHRLRCPVKRPRAVPEPQGRDCSALDLIVDGNGVWQTVPGLELLGRGCSPEAQEGLPAS